MTKTTLLLALSMALLSSSLPGEAKEKKAVAKRRIAVLAFEDKSGQSYGWHDIGTGMAEMLTTSLFKTGNFIIVERAAMEKAMEEQQLGLSGAVTPQTAAKLGRVIGAAYIITGSITEFGIKDSKLGVGNLGRKFGFDGGGNIQSQQARVGLDVRMIDVSTTQLLAAEKAEGTNTSRSIQADVDKLPSMEFGKEGFDSTTLGKATREAIEVAVKAVEKNLETVAWTGRVVKATEGRILINTGEEDGRKPGDEFVVERQGEELLDPETGESLGSEATTVGRIKITAVKGKKLSEAVPLSGTAFQTGDILKEPK